MGDTYVIWPHGKERLDLFFHDLNNQSSSIKFTMECEINGCLFFLDAFIFKEEDGSFSHQVFRKKTHIKQYLNAKSHNFPAQKLSVLNTLAPRALKVSDENHLEDEKTHPLNTFHSNGYSKNQCLKYFLKVEKGPMIKKELRDRFSGVDLLFIQGTTDKIARFLRKHKVPSTFRPKNTIKSSLKSVKDHVDPKNMKGVYLIPCSYGTPYIGEINRSINQRIHEHSVDKKT